MSEQRTCDPSVSVIVLAWGDEPLLDQCVRSALDSAGVRVEVIVVDNGAPEPQVEAVASLPGVRVLRPATNLGYAGGCNAGAAEATGDVLLFLNSDARLDSGAARALADSLCGDVGLVMASVRLWREPELMNSSGNPWHYTGFVWAGGWKEPASEHGRSRDITCASGATMAIRRALWSDLGGFDDAYFAYHEDAELSLRIWQRGLRVRFVAEATSFHDYEFSRNPNKMYLLERNRMMSLLTLYERRTLLLLAPVLAVVELGLIVLAAKQGWLCKKISGYVWLWRHRAHWLNRRRELQRRRCRSDRQLAGLFTPVIDAEALGSMPGLGAANRVLSAYWGLARRLLAR